MISVDHVRLMARYNCWQNEAVYAGADQLTDEARKADRGAFFGSIEATLNHLLWADRIWLHRFVGTGAPNAGRISDSIRESEGWDTLKTERKVLDQVIMDWALGLSSEWLAGELTWIPVGGGAAEWTAPKWELVTHMFNHQTHHRGQVHVMLTSEGIDTGDTDLSLMPR